VELSFLRVLGVLFDKIIEIYSKTSRAQTSIPLSEEYWNRKFGGRGFSSDFWSENVRIFRCLTGVGDLLNKETGQPVRDFLLRTENSIRELAELW
jgi:hypothetical protein